MSAGCNGAGCYGQRAVKINGIRDSADMPKLKQSLPIGVGYALRHAFPTRELFLRPDSGRVRVSNAHRRNRSSFGGYETAAGALLVALPYQLVGTQPCT